jgi:hypothetical protein
MLDFIFNEIKYTLNLFGTGKGEDIDTTKTMLGQESTVNRCAISITQGESEISDQQLKAIVTITLNLIFIQVSRLFKVVRNLNYLI